MIVLIRDNECFEPRIKTYIYYYKKYNFDYKVIGWNRRNIICNDSNTIFYDKKAEYGKAIKNIKPKLLWMKFVYNELEKLKDNISIIHACDIDAAIPAYLFCKKYKKRLIFDIFDWLTTAYGNNFGFKILEYLENFIYKRANYIILCEEERKKQAKVKNNFNNIYVLPNIPLSSFEIDTEIANEVLDFNKNYDITIGYVGVFEKSRGLIDILKAIREKKNVGFHIAGFGVEDKEIKEFIKNMPNVKYWGQVPYIKGQTILNNVDLMIALYYLSNPIFKFAAPNKYYESLKYGKPLITNNGTILAEKIKKYNTGFIIEENYESLLELLSNKELINEMRIKTIECNKIWNNIYKNYTKDFFENIYLDKIIRDI